MSPTQRKILIVLVLLCNIYVYLHVSQMADMDAILMSPMMHECNHPDIFENFSALQEASHCFYKSMANSSLTASLFEAYTGGDEGLEPLRFSSQQHAQEQREINNRTIGNLSGSSSQPTSTRIDLSPGDDATMITTESIITSQKEAQETEVGSSSNNSSSTADEYKTRVICDDGDCCSGIFINRSCVWSNLYYFNRKFHALAVSNDPATEFKYELHAVSSGIRHPPQYKDVHPFFFPEIKTFETAQALEEFASAFDHRRGVHLILSGGPHGNFGHAILDELYSIFVATCKFNLESTPHMTAIILDTFPDKSGPKDNFPIFRTAAGELLFEFDWDHLAKFRFERAVVGAGHMGLSTAGTDYVMAGRRYDALKKLRDRFYTRFERPPAIVRSSSMQLRSATDRTVLMIVPNRRYQGGLIDGLTALAAAAGYEVTTLNFGLPQADRLPIIRRCDVAFTGVGTGSVNLFLLSDGAVLANTGTSERSGHMSFQEEYLFAAMYWTRVVYPTYEQYRGMSPPVALDMVNEGRRLILTDFDCGPTAPGEANLSPVGRAAAEYFSHDLQAWGAFVGSYLVRPGEFDEGCFNMAERVLCEAGPWGAGRCAPLDKERLRQAREKHGACCSCP